MISLYYLISNRMQGLMLIISYTASSIVNAIGVRNYQH